MRPPQLIAGDFSAYPPQARKLATDYLGTLRGIPLSLLPTLLHDIRSFDWKFPPEQAEIVERLQFIESASVRTAGFATISVPYALEKLPWVNAPEHFIEELTAYLWSSQQMDAYRDAAAEFVQQLHNSIVPIPPVAPRLVMVFIGCNARPPASPMFRKLRQYGRIFSRIDVESAASAITGALETRAQIWRGPYAHWYLDGGSPLFHFASSGVTQLTYPALAPINQRILELMTGAVRAGTGPEALRTKLANSTPAELAAGKVTNDPIMQHFAISLLTEASGTQIFSTSFVQWAAREILRRAQPVTLCVRFTPRQRQRAFNSMLQPAAETEETDPDGSLIDADMGAYYTYLEMKKLPGGESATFMVYVEGRSQAFVAGPRVAEGTLDDSSVTLAQVIQMSVGK